MFDLEYVIINPLKQLTFIVSIYIVRYCCVWAVVGDAVTMLNAGMGREQVQHSSGSIDVGRVRAHRCNVCALCRPFVFTSTYVRRLCIYVFAVSFNAHAFVCCVCSSVNSCVVLSFPVIPG